MTRRNNRDRPVLLIDFSTREQYPARTVGPLFSEHGTIHVYDTQGGLPRTIYSMFKRLLRGRLPREEVARIFKRVHKTDSDIDLRHDLGIPSDSVIVHVRPGAFLFLKTLLKTLARAEYWSAISRMRSGQFVVLTVTDIDISGYVVDSILRFKNSSLFFYGQRSLAIARGVVWLSQYLTIASYAETLARKHHFRAVLINHIAYCESGMIAHIIKAELGNTVAVYHSQKAQYELAKLDQLPCSPFAVLTDKLISEQKGGDEIKWQPVWHDDHALNSVIETSRAKTRILLSMHCLSDANNIQDDGLAAFPNYIQWIRHSIEVARNHADLEMVIRLHPARDLYGDREERLYRHLFRDMPPNSRVLPPEHPDSDPRRPDSVVVTVIGSIALELACLGRKVVALGRPTCPESCYVRIQSRVDYDHLLTSGYRSFDDSLSPQDITDARNYRRAFYAAVDPYLT